MNRFIVIAAAAATVLFGCMDTSVSFVTWSTGLHVKWGVHRVDTTKAFKHVEGASVAVEQKGTIGSGDFVMQSDGTTTVTATHDDAIEWMIVGQTTTDNRLIPGEANSEVAEYGSAPVALVEAKVVTTGDTHTVDDTITEDPDKTQHTVRSESDTNEDHVTTAGTWGYAGQDYVVEIDRLDLLWNPDLVAQWHKDGSVSGVKALVKANVAVGDTWVMPDGNTMCHAVASESINNLPSVKVEMRVIQSVGEDRLVDKCLTVITDDTSKFTTSDSTPYPGEGETKTDVVHLDPGCAAAFDIGTIGSEWWHANVLVKADTTVHTIKIDDWGYEWVDDNGARQTAKSLDQNNRPGGAQLFVQFTVTETHRVLSLNAWDTQATPW